MKHLTVILCTLLGSSARADLSVDRYPLHLNALGGGFDLVVMTGVQSASGDTMVTIDPANVIIGEPPRYQLPHEGYRGSDGRLYLWILKKIPEWVVWSRLEASPITVDLVTAAYEYRHHRTIRGEFLLDVRPFLETLVLALESESVEAQDIASEFLSESSTQGSLMFPDGAKKVSYYAALSPSQRDRVRRVMLDSDASARTRAALTAFHARFSALEVDDLLEVLREYAASTDRTMNQPLQPLENPEEHRLAVFLRRVLRGVDQGSTPFLEGLSRDLAAHTSEPIVARLSAAMDRTLVSRRTAPRQ